MFKIPMPRAPLPAFILSSAFRAGGLRSFVLIVTPSDAVEVEFSDEPTAAQFARLFAYRLGRPINNSGIFVRIPSRFSSAGCPLAIHRRYSAAGLSVRSFHNLIRSVGISTMAARSYSRPKGG